MKLKTENNKETLMNPRKLILLINLLARLTKKKEKIYKLPISGTKEGISLQTLQTLTRL